MGPGHIKAMTGPCCTGAGRGSVGLLRALGLATAPSAPQAKTPVSHTACSFARRRAADTEERLGARHVQHMCIGMLEYMYHSWHQPL
jgi:hypothetical protein